MGKGKIKNFIKKAKDKIKKAGSQAAGFTVLLPFTILMRNMLKSKGYPAPTKLDELAVTFYNHIVKKKASYDARYSEVDHMDPATVSTIVSAVLEFISQVRKKKQNGETLTPEEQKIYEESEKAGVNVTETLKNEGPKENWLRDNWYWVAIGLIIAIVGYKLIKK